MGMACFSQGCNNPVIGQCQGYDESCGSFYCIDHSLDKLCLTCKTKKEHASYIQKILEEYEEIAKSIGKGPSVIARGIAAVFLCFGVGTIIFATEQELLTYNGYGQIPIIPLIIGVVALIAFAYWCITIIKRDIKKHNDKVTQAASNKPHFAEFYHEWRTATNAETWTKVLNVGLAVGGAIDGYNQEKTRQEVHKAAKKINRS